MRRISQASSYTVMLKLFLSSDHVSIATGKTVAIKLSKAGGAFADPNAGATNATEVANGWYKVSLDATDTNTLGDLVIRATATSCDDSEQIMQVVSATTGGASNLDVAVSSRSSHAAADVWSVGTRLLTSGTNIVLAKGTGVTGFNDLDASGVRGAVGMASANLDTQLAALPTDADVKTQADAALAAVGLTTTITGRIDADVSSRLAGASYTAPDNASIAAIKASTDNLPSDPADQSLVIAATTAIYNRIGAPAGADLAADVATVKSTSDGIKAKTDNLPASPAATGAEMTLTVAYDAAKTAASQTSVDDLPTNAELATALGDLATTATVDAIKAKTDSLTFAEPGKVDANIKAVNDVDVAGAGTSGAPWGPA